ncbi:MAG: hypothetical protein AB7O96_16175 [Pseudobdellovibrionaceae bacterium]
MIKSYSPLDFFIKFFLMKEALLVMLLLSGCVSIPVSKIKEKKIAGHWKSQYGFLSIYCSGALDIDIKDDRYLPGPYRRKETGSFISDISEDKIIVGPLSGLGGNFKVESWPHSKGSDVVMTIDGRDWHLDKAVDCE